MKLYWIILGVILVFSIQSEASDDEIREQIINLYRRHQSQHALLQNRISEYKDKNWLTFVRISKHIYENYPIGNISGILADKTSKELEIKLFEMTYIKELFEYVFANIINTKSFKNELKLAYALELSNITLKMQKINIQRISKILDDEKNNVTNVEMRYYYLDSHYLFRTYLDNLKYIENFLDFLNGKYLPESLVNELVEALNKVRNIKDDIEKHLPIDSIDKVMSISQVGKQYLEEHGKIITNLEKYEIFCSTIGCSSQQFNVTSLDITRRSLSYTIKFSFSVMILLLFAYCIFEFL